MNSNNLGRLGGQLGVLMCLLGFGAIFFGWNGAASKNVSMAQFPYLISGGVTGIALVVIGAAMLIIQNAREDRARMEAVLERLATAMETSGGAPGRGAGAPAANGGAMVLAGTTSYHRLDCSLGEARDDAHVVDLDEAFRRQLDPCRVCRPPAIAPAGY